MSLVIKCDKPGCPNVTSARLWTDGTGDLGDQGYETYDAPNTSDPMGWILRAPIPGHPYGATIDLCPIHRNYAIPRYVEKDKA